uniref:Uncharacterized protein n=1 Tax=Aegilops tauschii subsp. strangulata TaxID=200361 RepID=A0A453PV05_AEGTS
MGYEGFLFTPFQAEEEQAEAFVRATRAEPEKEAAILKAKEEAEADQEQASLKAKAGKEPGCGSKRKAEEGHEEAPPAVDVMIQFNGEDDSEDEFYKACMADDSFDYDSDDDLEVCAAKCEASFERCMEAACYARSLPSVGGQGQGGEC